MQSDSLGELGEFLLEKLPGIVPNCVGASKSLVAKNETQVSLIEISGL